MYLDGIYGAKVSRCVQFSEIGVRILQYLDRIYWMGMPEIGNIYSRPTFIVSATGRHEGINRAKATYQTGSCPLERGVLGRFVNQIQVRGVATCHCQRFRSEVAEFGRLAREEVGV